MKREVASAKLMGVGRDVVSRVAIKVSSAILSVTGMVAAVYAAFPSAHAQIEEPDFA